MSFSQLTRLFQSKHSGFDMLHLVFTMSGALGPLMAYVCEDGLLNYFKLQFFSQCFVHTQENQNQENDETSTESNNVGHVSMEMKSSSEVT